MVPLTVVIAGSIVVASAPSQTKSSHDVTVVFLNFQPHAPSLRGHIHFAFAILLGLPPGKFWSSSHRAMQTFRLFFALMVHVKVGELARPTWVTSGSSGSHVEQVDSSEFQKYPLCLLYRHRTRRRPIARYPGWQMTMQVDWSHATADAPSGVASCSHSDQSAFLRPLLPPVKPLKIRLLN